VSSLPRDVRSIVRVKKSYEDSLVVGIEGIAEAIGRIEGLRILRQVVSLGFEFESTQKKVHTGDDVLNRTF
jgi:hypothetical protein